LNIFNHDQEVFLGQALIIQGQVIGNPRPAIVWQHPRGHTLVDDGVNIHTYYHDDGTIQLQVLFLFKKKGIVLEYLDFSFFVYLCKMLESMNVSRLVLVVLFHRKFMYK
jgi:hypothetical protein